MKLYNIMSLTHNKSLLAKINVKHENRQN